MFARRSSFSHSALRQLLASSVLWHTQVAAAQHPEAATTERPDSTNGLVIISAATTAPLTIFVDGKAIGPAPRQVALSPGMHEITAFGTGILANPVHVRVEPQKTISIGLTVVPEPAQFEIDPVVPDAMLFVDGKAVGFGKRVVRLTPGKHSLELRREGHQPQRLSAEVRSGQRAQLRAAPYVAIMTSPPAAAPTRGAKQQASPAVAAPTQSAKQQASPAVAAPTQSAKQQASPAVAAPAQTKQDQGANAGTSQAPIAAPEPSPPSPYRGIFGSFIVPIMLGGKSTHSYLDDCPAKPYDGACTATAPRGGGLALRLGYFYEWVGLELVGGGAVDITSTELKLPPISTIPSAMQDAAGRNVFIRAGGMYGLGLRLAVPMQGLRITVGADYLFVHRKVYAIPDSFAGTSLSYKVPGWLIDGGIQLGSTPGARFYLGAFVLLEQAHDLPLTRNLSALGIDSSLVPEALTKMTVYRGRQIFYGPLLGIAFGH